VLINACRPIYRRTDFPPTVAVSPELREKIMAKWGGLFEQQPSPLDEGAVVR
jgi:hypothetical protein